jgi:hypothetical protein
MGSTPMRSLPIYGPKLVAACKLAGKFNFYGRGYGSSNDGRSFYDRPSFYGRLPFYDHDLYMGTFYEPLPFYDSKLF